MPDGYLGPGLDLCGVEGTYLDSDSSRSGSVSPQPRSHAAAATTVYAYSRMLPAMGGDDADAMGKLWAEKATLR